MLENVNTTINGTQSWSCPSNLTAEKIGKTFAYCLIFIVSLAGNTVIGIIVYKRKTLRKPIKFFFVNTAMSVLLIPIFVIPPLILILYRDSWLIGGPLGQGSLHVSQVPSYQMSPLLFLFRACMILIAVDRFGAVVFPLRSPLISSKLCPFFILSIWIVAIAVNSTELFVFKLVEYPEKLVCERHWNEVFGESSSLENYIMSCLVVFNFISVLIAILYIIIYLKLKSQKIQASNIGQHWTTPENGAKCVKDDHCYCFRVSSGLAVPRYTFFLLFTNRIIWSNCGHPYFFYVVSLMAIANCAINPCICFISSGNYIS